MKKMLSYYRWKYSLLAVYEKKEQKWRNEKNYAGNERSESHLCWRMKIDSWKINFMAMVSFACLKKSFSLDSFIFAFKILIFLHVKERKQAISIDGKEKIAMASLNNFRLLAIAQTYTFTLCVICCVILLYRPVPFFPYKPFEEETVWENI